MLRAASGAAATFATCTVLATNGHADRTVQWVVFLHAGLVALPLAMFACLALACAALTLLLALLSTPHWVRRRPLGLGDLLRQVWQLPTSVLPGYWRALRRVDSPLAWGAVAGTTAWLATHLGQAAL